MITKRYGNDAKMKNEQHIIKIIATIYIWYSVFSRVLLTTTFVSNSIRISRFIGILALIFRCVLIALEASILINRKVQIKHFLNLVILTVLVILLYFSTGDWVLFDVFFFVFCFSKYVSAERIYKLISRTLFFSVTIIVLMSLIHIVPTEIYSRGEEQIRHTFGFNHPNAFGGHILYLVIFYVLSKKKTNIIDVFLSFFSAGIAYIFPNSRTSCMCLMIIGLYIFVCNCNFSGFLKTMLNNHRKLFKGVLLTLFLLVVFIYLFAFSDSAREHLAGISGTFYRRFLYGKWAYARYRASFCGQHVDMVNDKMLLAGGDDLEYFNIDCTYFYLPIVLGILPTLYYVFWYIRGIYLSIQVQKRTLLFMFILIAISGVSEIAMIFYSSYLLIGVPLYETKKNLTKNN